METTMMNEAFNGLNLSTGLVFVLVFLVTILFLRSWTRRLKLPPGPTPWPIIGNIKEIAGKPRVFEELQRLRKEYGDIYTIYLGSRPAVVLNNHKLVKEALVDKAEYFSDRPRWLRGPKENTNSKGIIWNPHGWREMRKFTLTALKDFGLGKKSLEDKIIEEVAEVVREMEETDGKPFRLHPLLNQATCNIICCVIFGKRFNYDDEELHELLSLMEKIFTRLGLKNQDDFIPWLRFFRSKNETAETRKIFDTVKDFIRKNVEEHRTSYDTDNIRDFIDLYIQAEAEGTSNGKIEAEDLFQSCIDLFMAGTETTSTTLRWFLLYMILRPDIQQKCRDEILKVIGDSRMPTVKDRGTMHYVEATMLETQRLANIAPVALPHTANADVELAGYMIPKDAQVIPNLHGVQLDEAAWSDPESFQPERWLDDAGNVKKMTAFMPFSVGRRMCLGDQLAKNELFLFATTLIQKFEFKMADKSDPPSLEGIMGITHMPKNFPLTATKV